MYQQKYQQNDVPIGLTVDTQAKHRLRSATPGWNLKKDLRTSPASIFPETWPPRYYRRPNVALGRPRQSLGCYLAFAKLS